MKVTKGQRQILTHHSQLTFLAYCLVLFVILQFLARVLDNASLPLVFENMQKYHNILYHSQCSSKTMFKRQHSGSENSIKAAAVLHCGESAYDMILIMSFSYRSSNKTMILYNVHIN